MTTWVGIEGEYIVPQMSTLRTVTVTLHTFYLLFIPQFTGLLYIGDSE
jgi:hypothetical protein